MVGKFLKILAWIFLALVLLPGTVLIGGKIWVEHHLLRHEIHVGTGTLRIYGGSLRWDLKFHSDSLWYRDSTVQARVGNLDVHYWFPVFVHVDLDTVFVHLSSRHKPKSDSAVVFPALKIPVKITANIRAVTLENDSGPLLSAWNLHARNPASMRAAASIGKITSPHAVGLNSSVFARINWSDKDSVDAELKIKNGKDQVYVVSREAKSDLSVGHVLAQVQIQDSRPYTRAFGLQKKNLPFVRNTNLNASVTHKNLHDDLFEAHLFLQSEVDGFSDSLPLILSPQRLEVHVDGTNQAAHWQIKTQGRVGELLSLGGNIRELKKSGKNPAADSALPLWKRYAASAQGVAEKFRVRAGKKILLAGAHLQQLDWNGEDLAASLTTDDSSRVQLQAHLTGVGASVLPTGNFSLHLSPSERWVTAFLDTNVSFAALDANGKLLGKTVTASLQAKTVSAYGVKVDSLTSQHVYSARGYELESAQLYVKKDVWSASGSVKTGGKFPEIDFTLKNPEYGSLRYWMMRDSMRVTADHFHVGALPYALLQKVPVQNPIVNGTFAWSPKHRDGNADLQALADFQKQTFLIESKLHWDARTLELENLLLHAQRSSLVLQARVKLNGKQFYELNKLRVSDYSYVALETPGFDLAWVESIFRAQPFLQSGQLQGSLAYADSGGFQGLLTFTGVAPREAIGDVTLKKLQLAGTGDTLVVSGVTQSESTPLFRDSLQISVNHLLQDTQQVRIEVVAADSLHLHLAAVTPHFAAFQGRLQMDGNVALPSNSGLLRNLNVDMDFSFPSKNTLMAATLTTRTFSGDYVIPPLIRQHISLNPVLRDGELKIPNVTLKDENGRMLQAHVEYVLKNKSLHAQVSGDEAAAQWADNKVSLRDLQADFRLDSSGVQLHGGFSNGDILYVDAPLHAEGSLRNVNFAYRKPATPKNGRAVIPSLELSGALSQSLIRYRLKSLSAITDLFQKQGNKKRSGRIHPIQLNVSLHTFGDSNRVDSDILRMIWVGNIEMQGVYPYTLTQGRINSLSGELGLENQAYQIRQLEVKWLNSPMEEGEIQMEARKTLASHCDATSSSANSTTDSCNVITRLNGTLDAMQFSYDSDCGGAFGAGANVAAMLYSVERGCYDPSFSNGGSSNYGQKALTLLEPTISNSLTGIVGRYSHSWIASTQVTGLGSLAGPDSVSDSLSQPLSLEVTSKDVAHVRLRLKSGYHVESQDLSSPWENVFAVEWRPPLQNYVEDPKWKHRLKDHVSVTASVHTVPQQRNVTLEDPVQKTLGLVYNYDFWGHWWARKHVKPHVVKSQLDTVR